MAAMPRRTKLHRLILPISLLFLFTSPGNSQDPLALVRQWMPFAIGDRWIYEYEIRGGDRRNPDIERWQQAEVVVAMEAVPEGVLIRRKIALLNNTAPPARAPLRPVVMRADEANILIRGNCIYYLNAWPGSLRSLTDFLEAQRNGEALPDVCFPLNTGRTWGDPNKGRDLWTVAGLGRKNIDDPPSVTPQSWRLEANLASGDNDHIWFQTGVGITAARSFHNGTYGDLHLRLLRFEPASPGR